MSDFLNREDRRASEAGADQIIEQLHRMRDTRNEFERNASEATGEPTGPGRFADPALGFYRHGPASGPPTDSDLGV